MYHIIVRQIIRQGFRALSQGNYEAILKQFAPNVHFLFEGEHAMGSELHNIESVRRWFERVLRLFPGLQFQPQQIIVSGWPWDTVAVTHLQVQATLRNGSNYQNTLIQIVRLRWGRVVDDYVLENTQKLVAALQEQAKAGIIEAIATPIKD